MKHLFVLAAALGSDMLRKHGKEQMAALTFRSIPSFFPALTCPVQASWRTGLLPSEHRLFANGVFMEGLRRPLFWEQSTHLIQSPNRIWSCARRKGASVGLYFWQQAMGENVDALITPAPIHKHGGGMIMRNYSLPPQGGEALQKICGTFPLHRYWGPLASPRVGRDVIQNFKTHVAHFNVDVGFLYLPTLDYEAQRFGPDSPQAVRALNEFQKQLEDLANWTQHQGCTLTVCGDYAISPVTQAPVFPNQILRQAEFFKTRPIGSRAYPDFATSRAFALCDHELAFVYILTTSAEEYDVTLQKVHALFEASGSFEQIERCVYPVKGPCASPALILYPPKGSWCAYPWWTHPKEAPDWATHVDIHNKPGYDPCELFFARAFPPQTCQDASRIKGTHGRSSSVAWASTSSSLTPTTSLELTQQFERFISS